MAEENEYATPKAFLDLYHSFTGNADPSYPAKSNIGSMLSGAVQRNEVGPLILATPTGLYLYDSHSRKRIGGAIYRAGRPPPGDQRWLPRRGLGLPRDKPHDLLNRLTDAIRERRAILVWQDVGSRTHQ